MHKQHLILCGDVPQDRIEGYDVHPLSLGESEINLDIKSLNDRILQELPPVLRDLLDIATYVYVGDQVVSRGGTKSFDYGEKWYRCMLFRIPVRKLGIWSNPQIVTLLEEALLVASGNTFQFEFYHLKDDRFSEYLGLAEDDKTDAGYDEVLLFSGGLDSFTGAVDEVVRKGHRPVLVSHQSHGRMTRLQRDLFGYIHDVSPHGRRPLHVPVMINKDKNLTRETSQRTRSFLYAALGAVIARVFNLKRVRFYENGIVSCNLPWDGQTLQARATRSTHPQLLSILSELISEVVDIDFTVENPYFHRTRTEACELLKRMHHEVEIARTRSCARSYYQNPETHCGVCSQCVDRRFATLAAKCAEHDPDWLYALKIFKRSLPNTHDRTMLLGYVGFTNSMDTLDLDGFIQQYPQVHQIARNLRTASGEQVYQLLYDLHMRHAVQVNSVLDDQLRANSSKIRKGALPADCLLQMVAAGRHLPTHAVNPKKKTNRSQKTTSLDKTRKKKPDDMLILHAALMKHHGFDEKEMNLTPATQKELVDLTEWNQPKVHRMMKKLFGEKPMTAYKSRCKQKTIKGFLARKDDGSYDVEAIAS